MLEDQKDQMATLKSMVEQNIVIRSECSCCDHRKYGDFDHEENNDNSEELVEWLRRVNTDEQSIKKVCYFFSNFFYYLIYYCTLNLLIELWRGMCPYVYVQVVYEEFRLDQIRRDVTREDLRSLGLK